MSSSRLIIGVIDADHYELQLFQKQPQWKYTIGLPTVVVDDSGLIVSLSPEAKFFGVQRLQNINNAQKMCHNLLTITKKLEFNKPATKELIRTSYKIRSSILTFFSELYQNYNIYNIPIPIVEKTGNDEYFIDLTELVVFLLNMNIEYDEVDDTFFLEGQDLYNGEDVEELLDSYWDQDNYKGREEVQMVTGGKILEQLRQQIHKDTGIVCSGGVGSNKLLAKLSCKINKPNAITCITRKGFKRVAKYTPFRDITGFGGLLGNRLESIFGPCSIQQLQRHVFQGIRGFRKVDTKKVGMLANAVCHKPVEDKLYTKYVNCGKRNLGINTKSEFKTQLNYLCQNMVNRLYEEWTYNKRQTKFLNVQYTYGRRWLPESFEVDTFRLNTFSAEWKEPQETTCFMNAVVSVAIEENSDFNNHLNYGINSINLHAHNFTNYGPIY